MGFNVFSSVARYCARSSPWRSADQPPTTALKTLHSSTMPKVGTALSGRQCSCTIPPTNLIFSHSGIHTDVTAVMKRATVSGASSAFSASATSSV